MMIRVAMSPLYDGYSSSTLFFTFGTLFEKLHEIFNTIIKLALTIVRLGVPYENAFSPYDIFKTLRYFKEIIRT